MIAELDQMQKRLAEIRALVEKNAADREANGCCDDELLTDCMRLLEYATFHDGRYGQRESHADFQEPAQKLVARLGKRLQIKPYSRFGA